MTHSYPWTFKLVFEYCDVVCSVFPLKKVEYGVYGHLVIIYGKPYSIYLRGTI